MAFGLKNLGLGGKDSNQAPMTVAEGVSDASPGGGVSFLPAFFTKQPVTEQMKSLGGIFVILLLAISTLVYFNNHFRGQAVHGARDLGQLLLGLD